ncbi:MAG TPA: hypothetical protein VJZ76_19380 [Thermoanaerobaculia bacterium]|nr:hypothetical protein [Thermoanaerobaculia bacterium]
MNAVLDGAAGSIDSLNFHYYQSPRHLGTVADWLRQRTQRAGYSVPLLTNEMSLRSAPDQCNPAAPFSAATLDRQARLVFQYLTSARGNDVGPVVWFSIDTICDPNRTADQYNASLFNQDTSLRPPGAAWARVAATLGTSARVARISDGPNLFEAQFPNGLYAAWTASSPETIVLDGAAATVTDYAGNVSSVSGQTATAEPD